MTFLLPFKRGSHSEEPDRNGVTTRSTTAANTIIAIESLSDMWGHPHNQRINAKLPDRSPASKTTLRVLSTFPPYFTAWSPTPENPPSTPWPRSGLTATEHMKRREDVRCRGISAIEHHFRVADGREIAGAVHQQHGHVVCDFENAMDQPSGKVTLLRVDKHAADETRAAVAGSERRFRAVLSRGDLIRVQAQRKSYRRKQFAVSTIKQNGLLRSHDI